MKKIIVSILCFFSLSCFANDVPLVQPAVQCKTTDVSSPSFCKDFADIAYCNCGNSTPGGEGFCRKNYNVDKIFHLFADRFGGDAGIDSACKYGQTVTSLAKCAQEWKRYRGLDGHPACPPALS